MAASRSSIEVASYAGKRSRRPRARVGRRQPHGMRSKAGACLGSSAGGCRQRITRGVRPPAEGWRGEKGERRARPRSRRRRWPCPPLRPKRSALWAPQGYAPGKANDPDKSRTRKGDTFNEVRKGTFLTSFDIRSTLPLTPLDREIRVTLAGGGAFRRTKSMARGTL